MKDCTSCGARNPDGARFCVACGSSLVPGCPTCGTELPESARFCPSCGTTIAQPDAPPTGHERKLVTILFADVTGSTELGERLDPERLRQLLDAYFAAMREEIEAEGGTVEKFIGDAVMAAFGVPVAHEDDPARALRAALRMRRRLARLNDELAARYGVTLQVRIGVNTGEVLATTAPQPGEAMVTGDAVNAAARLEQLAEPGQIVVAERTARATRTFRFRELGDVRLRGKDERVHTVLLEAAEPGSIERGVPGLRAPMVGRDQELALLQTVFARVVAEERPSLVTIYGEPGVGKSRLTQEFLTWSEADLRPPSVVRGRCLPYGEGVTYWPLAEILKSLAGVRDSDGPQETLERLTAFGAEILTETVSPDPRKATAALAYTVGVEDPDFGLGRVEPREVRAKIHASWRSLFSGLAQRSPVVAVIEDIHWADPALLDLLQELPDRVMGPVLLICTARPELTEGRADWGGGRRNMSSVSLDPLSREEADRLVGLLLSIDELPEAIHRRILERAEGNPFFLEEIVRHLIDEGRIVRDGDRWRATGAIADVEIPDTVQAVLAARIDLLRPLEKRALQRAAVVGRVFWPGPVERLMNGDRERLRETLERLEERELVLSRLGSSIAGQPEFIFKHILTREVAYESLPRRDRGRSHAAVAYWIEETAGERAREFVELLAYHYVEAYRASQEAGEADPDDAAPAGLRERAIDTLLVASEEARRRFAVEKALRLAEQAHGIATDPLQRSRALEQIGIVAISDYRGDLAWRSLSEAADLRMAHAPQDRRSIARVCGRAVEPPTRWPGSMREQPTEAEVERYLDAGFANADDEEGEELVRLLIARAFGPFSIGLGRELRPGEAESSAEAGRRAAEIAERIGRIDLASAALDGAASVHLTDGRYGAVLRLVDQRIELSRDLEDPWELGDIYAMAAWGRVVVGEYTAARAFAEEGATRAEGEAEGVQIHNLCWGATASFFIGDWDAVVGEALPRVERLLGDREPPYFTAALFGPAAFIAATRRHPDAARLRDIVERSSGTSASRSVALAAWRAWLLSREGRVDEALEQLDAGDAVPSKATRPLFAEIRACVLAETRRFEAAEAFLEATTSYANAAGLVALPVHLDRLRALVRLERGDATALELLRQARAGFERLEAAWEVARTDLWLAEALADAGAPDEAGERLRSALGVFEELASMPEIERAQELGRRIG